MIDCDQWSRRACRLIVSRRAARRAEFLSVLTPYVEALTKGPVERAAIVAATRILEIDPRQDIAYRALIQAYQERGDATRADQYTNIDANATTSMKSAPTT